jgi:CRISPR-associated protein Cas2
MPYYIAVYDFHELKLPRAIRLFRRYLNWVQNSVFEGELTKAQFARLKWEAGQLADPEWDSVIFYELRDERYAERTVVGLDKGQRGRFL